MQRKLFSEKNAICIYQRYWRSKRWQEQLAIDGKRIYEERNLTLILATDSVKCRMCGEIDENLSHLVSESNELAQYEYKLKLIKSCGRLKLVNRGKNWLDHNNLDLLLLEKEKICYIEDAVCPFDPRIEKKRIG